MVSDDKSAINLIETPLSVICSLPLAASKILLVFVFQQFNYRASRCGSLWIFPTLSSSYFEFVELLGCCRLMLSSIWGVFSHCSFKYSFCSPTSHSGTPIICMLVYLMVSHRPQGSAHFSSPFFSFCSSDSIISIYHQVCWFLILPAHICCWTTLVNFLFQLLKFSTPDFPFGSFKNNF